MRTALAFSLAVLIASPIFAQDEKKKRRKGQGQRGQAANLERFFSLPGIEFGADQKAKVAELKEEFGPKLQEVQQKLGALLTEEQKQARRKVNEEARTAAGQRREGLREKIEAALNLSDEQKDQYQSLQKEQRELTGKIRRELTALLTDEQKEQARKRRAEGGRKKKKKETE